MYIFTKLDSVGCSFFQHTVEDQTVVLLSEMKMIKQAIAEVAVKHVIFINIIIYVYQSSQ